MIHEELCYNELKRLWKELLILWLITAELTRNTKILNSEHYIYDGLKENKNADCAIRLKEYNTIFLLNAELKA